MSYILGVKWLSGCSDVGDHKVYSIRYILRKNTNNKKNSLRQNKCYKKTLFTLTSSNTHHSFNFNLQFFCELKYKVHHFSKSLCGIFHFDSVLFLLKFIFYFKGASKNCKSVRKGIFFNWDLLHPRLNSHYKAWSYKKNKQKKSKASRKSVLKESTVNRCLLILDLKPFRS